MKYLLLGTAGCHLCELAEEIMRDNRISGTATEVELVDIAEHSQWQQDYATRIPVLLQPESLQYLAWPFTQADVLTFISKPL